MNFENIIKEICKPILFLFKYTCNDFYCKTSDKICGICSHKCNCKTGVHGLSREPSDISQSDNEEVEDIDITPHNNNNTNIKNVRFFNN